MLLSELGYQWDHNKPWTCDYDWLMWMDCDSLVSRYVRRKVGNARLTTDADST
jgi:hypothetical protein